MNFDINNFMQTLLTSALPYLFAVTIHEASHAYAAYALGDNTAKNAGRLSLNPLVHVDPLGLLCLLVTQMFGWAKPVPFNPAMVKKHKYGILIVGAAGPISNFILMFISALLLIIALKVGNAGMLPLSVAEPIIMMLQASIMINITLGVFNLIPIPPLDGSRILIDLLPRHLAYKYAMLERYGFVIVMALVFLGATKYLRPVMSSIYLFVMEFVISGVSL